MRRVLKAGLVVVAGLALAGEARAQASRFEPNQTRRNATKLSPGDEKGILCNDDDWFVVEVPDGQRLEAQIHFQKAEGDLDLEVQDARGHALGWSREQGDEEAVAVTPRAGGPLFVHVGNARATYDLHLGLSPSGLASTAQGLSGTVAGWGSDWVTVAAKSGQEVHAALRFAHDQGDLDLALVSDQGQELATSSGQGDEEAVRWTASEDQTVLVHVTHVQRARAGYSLEVTVGAAQRTDLVSVFRAERPEGAGNDLLELRSGDAITGRVLDESIRIATPYADLSVPVARLAGLDLERRQSEVEALVTVDEERLSGFLRTEALHVQVAGLEAPVAIRRERLVRVLFGRRGQERSQPAPGTHLLVLQSGDTLRAKVGAAAWTLDLGFARMPIALEQVQSMAFEGQGVVSLIRTDQSIARGRLDVETVEVTLALGPTPTTVRLHVDRLSTLQPGDAVPTGRLGAAELQQLARALGATVPRGLLRELAQAATPEKVRQLRGLVPVQDDGAPALERAVLATDALDLRYAWFEVLLRVDKGVRDRLVRAVQDESEDRRLRQATAVALVDLARDGGPTQPVEQACGAPAGAELVFPLVMSSNDEQLMQKIMPLMRNGFRGGRMVNQGQDEGKTHEALAEALPRLLGDR